MGFRFAHTHTIRLWFAFFLLVTSMAVFCADAFAQNYRATLNGTNGRNFPEGSFSGVFKIIQYPEVEINGVRQRMVPGTRLYDVHNRIVPPASYTGQKLNVVYIRFGNGELHSVWMLTPQEARVRRASENPTMWRRFRDRLSSWVDLAKWLGLTGLGL